MCPIWTLERGKNETVYSKSGRGVAGYDRKKR